MDAVAEIARRHRLRGEARRYADGSMPVFAVGHEHVVKLFPAASRRNRDNERDALALLSGRLPVATPALHASGELEEWSYIVMSQLPGVSLEPAWAGLAQRERLALAGQVGALLRALHALETDGAALPHAVAWDELMTRRRAVCVEVAGRSGADPTWVARIESFLASVELAAGACAFLHTEVMPAHLLAREGRLSGLVDFEPAMLGPPEYELASIGIFFSMGDRAVMARLLDAHGSAAPGLERRLMAYALLHRYSNLRWYLERMPPGPGVASFDHLAIQWFGS
jgi:hygromycin-B 7''-O-kinase